MDVDPATPTIYTLNEKTYVPSPPIATDYRSNLHSSETPIIIDNGKYSCDARWSQVCAWFSTPGYLVQYAFA
ncbi:hypothetical protein BC938DRAFT_478910 [Jimgerdemannia flammicorona]|uniref:Uncharacterized protein n=1 Tax=Jimgerdemannia flammicorona TaxID=994334 RepID=A0A433QM40_9FUNG|nr:hypothetical protein BC938DRAFT_478910 [Jimgerdemannia flammicorona]